jgi:antitoxin CptB
MNITDKVKQLAWQCRRGMLEIDILVKRYLDHHYVSASDADRVCFEQFLTENDQNLFEWLTGKTPAPRQDYQALIAIMRSKPNDSRPS